MGTRSKTILTPVISIMVLELFAGVTLADVDTIYKKRGNYFEGQVTQQQAGGQGLVLISAILINSSPPEDLPKGTMSLQFFMPEDSQPHIRITDRAGDLGYLMDQYVPPANQQWKAQEWNDISWSTDVLSAVKVFKYRQLAYLVRLSKDISSTEEHVSPILIGQFPAQEPASVFRFVVCANESVTLTHKLLAGASASLNNKDDGVIFDGECRDVDVHRSDLNTQNEVSIDFDGEKIGPGGHLRLLVHFQNKVPDADAK